MLEDARVVLLATKRGLVSINVSLVQSMKLVLVESSIYAVGIR